MTTTGRTVLVTGAAGHLGRAVAEAFERIGANLVLTGRLPSLQRTHGGEHGKRMFAPADLLDQRQVDAAVAGALERFGRIDVLCNLAGGFRMGSAVHETSTDDWSFLFDVNLRTLLHAARAVVPTMLDRGGGKVVNVAAAAAQRGAARMGAYAASKAGVIRLTEAMSAELRDRNINVNCVVPTIIDTPDNRRAMPGADPARWVAPADLANVIVFLASPESVAIHGAAIPVAGRS